MVPHPHPDRPPRYSEPDITSGLPLLYQADFLIFGEISREICGDLDSVRTFQGNSSLWKFKKFKEM